MSIKMLWYGAKMQAKMPRPRGFIPIGGFFLFGATMAAYAAITLLNPGSALDAPWALNKTGHHQLIALGKPAAVGFAVLSVLMCGAALGWFRRRYWGWVLGTSIIAINAAGDLINGARGEWLKGSVGVVIAGIAVLHDATESARLLHPRI